MSDASPGPVLITGLDHSGKTPLRVALGAHPDLALMRRAYLWTWFDGRFGPLDRPENLARCVDAMERHAGLRALAIDPQEAARQLEPGPMTYDRLFGLIGSQVARRLGRPRWGIQESHLEAHADRLLAAFPTATIIQLVRDPRTWLAAVSASGPRRGGVGIATLTWLTAARAGLRNVARHPGRYRIVQFEELAADPQRALSETCAAIAAPAARAVLEAAARLELDAGKADTVAPTQRAYIEAEAGEVMAALGYHGRTELRGADGIRFRLVTRPEARAVALVWRGAGWLGPRVGRSLPGHKGADKVRLRDS